MILFLFGPDVFRLRKKIKEIVSYYKNFHKSGLNLIFFEGEKLNFQFLKEKFQTVSMFKEKKLFIIKNIDKNKDFKKKFLENIKKFSKSENTILFSQEGEIPKNDEFFETLKRYSKWQQFKLLSGEKLKNWVKKEFKKYGTEIEEKALSKLIDFVGNDLWQMENEIQKLVNYKDGKKIEKRDVEILVGPKIEPDIFKTVDAICQRDKKKAINLIHQHLEKGDSPLYLLAMINFQLRNILILKSGGKLNAHPFVVKKSSFQAKKFSLEEIRRIYQKIFFVDLKIKTGQISPESALDFLIAEI